MKTVIHIGLDVDDNAFHGYAISDSNIKEGFAFKSRPTMGDLLKKLIAISKEPGVFHVCYEAGYLGFTLARALRDKGYKCDVIAPHMIPRQGNRSIKTDRIDSKNLSLMLSKGLLTACDIPDVDTESVRALMRSRAFMSRRIRTLKNHTVSLCRKSGFHFKQETSSKAYWTVRHRAWLSSLINHEGVNAMLAFNLKQLLTEINNEETRVAEYDDQIAKLAHSDTYREPVEALSCFRGVSTIAAMAIAAETGDINRFAHPTQLMSYAGLGVREYSSGGKEVKFGITKTGNAFLRQIVVESSQKIYRSATLSDEVRRRQDKTRSEYGEIVNKGMKRMNKKGMHLLLRGKHTNLVKVACAREMLGFLWEAMKKAKAHTELQSLVLA